jgi:2-haloacid dehalogenase
LKHFEFFQLFEGILVSGEEMMKKPDPRIYQLILDRYQIVPQKAIFIDDSKPNIEGAEAFDIKGIYFQSPEQLEIDLKNLGIL